MPRLLVGDEVSTQLVTLRLAELVAEVGRLDDAAVRRKLLRPLGRATSLHLDDVDAAGSSRALRKARTAIDGFLGRLDRSQVRGAVTDDAGDWLRALAEGLGSDLDTLAGAVRP